MDGKIIATSVAGVLLVLVMSTASVVTDAYNADVTLRTKVLAKQEENKSNFDNMWKKIKQTTNVTDAYKEGFKDVLVAYTSGRKIESKNLLMQWGKEAVPNFDSSMYKQLNNIIVASRDDFNLDQKQLIDLKREHDMLIDKFPGCLIYRILGKEKIEIKIVTSTKTDKSYESGKDDEI